MVCGFASKAVRQPLLAVRLRGGALSPRDLIRLDIGRGLKTLDIANTLHRYDGLSAVTKRARSVRKLC